MSTVPTLSFGLSEFTTNPWNFAQDVENYRRLGVTIIEICEVKLDREKARAQVAGAVETGMTVSSVQPATRTLFPSQTQKEPRDVPARMERFRQTIRALAPVVDGAPFITNMGIAPDGNLQHARDVAVREYRALAEFAAEQGVRVALEPLNAAIMNVETSIWTLQQGLEIVHEVDHPAFGICLDFWNVWQNADIEETIRANGEHTFVVQVSDWRSPRSFEDRLIPGQGSIPLAALLRAVHDSGYRGPHVVEIFSGNVPDALWDGDLERVITESRAGMEAAWKAAFAATRGA